MYIGQNGRRHSLINTLVRCSKYPGPGGAINTQTWFFSDSKENSEVLFLSFVWANITEGGQTKTPVQRQRINPSFVIAVNWISISSTTTTETATQVLAEEPNAIVTSDPGLTTFAESSNEIKVVMEDKRAIERAISQPYTIPAPKDILERNYLVDSYNWIPATTYRTVAFPAAFNSISTITDTMKRYRFWRATIHVEVKLSSTQFHQGSLLVSWVPCPGSMDFNDVRMLSGMPSATVLSASTQDSCSFDIPWMHPMDWMEWSIYKNSYFHSMLTISQLNPLTATSSGIAATCPVLVYASMKNVEVSGYVSQSKKGGPKFSVNSEAHEKQQSFDAKGAVSTVSKIARSLPVVGQVWSPIADAINAFAGNLSKPVSEKPPDNQAPFREVNLASGVEDVTQMSLYPNAQLAQGPEMFGMDTSHRTVSNIVQQPMLFDQVTFDGVTTGWSTGVDPRANGDVDYLGALSRNFKFWRGGIKYLVHFCMPAFYQFRVMFSVDYSGTTTNNGDITTRIVDIKGDTWQTIEIPYLWPQPWQSCDGAVEGYTPRFRITQLTSILGSTAVANPKVYVNIFRAAAEDWEFSVPRGDSTTPGDRKNKVHYRDQMLLRKKFQEKFLPIIDGVKQSYEKGNCMPEVVSSVSDLCKRTSPTPYDASSIWYSRGTVDQDLFSMMRRLFLFWRGSRTLRRIPYLDTAGAAVKIAYLNTGSYTPSVCDGWTMVSTAGVNTQFVEGMNVPYYAQIYYQPMPSQSLLALHDSCYNYPPLDLTLSSTLLSGWMINGGDDYVMLFLVPYFLTGPSSLVSKKEESKKASS